MVWHAGMHPSDLVEESRSAEEWPLTTVYSELGLAVLGATLDVTRCLKAACSSTAARHFQRKLCRCESTLTEVVAKLEKATGDSHAGSDAVSLQRGRHGSPVACASASGTGM